MRRRISALLFAALLGGAHAAWAQVTPSNLVGIVKDAQGAVLPGVTVTATSPALIGTQTAVSEGNGTYRLPNLPPGTYTIKFELQGFQTVNRPNVVLAIGQTLTVDAQLQVASLQENVTVTAEAPVVDTTTSAIGNTLDVAKLTAVPSSTDLWGALAQAPGVHMDGFDVGGSHKLQQTGYEAFGIGNQTRIVTEGVDTTEGQNGAGFYQDYFAQNEVAVSGAGQDVTMNAPGAAVISTIKSGGNQFRGLFNQTYEPSSFVGNNADAADAARGGSAQPNLLYWENHDDMGGPIVKDKAWFFVAYNHFHLDKALSGVPQNIATQLGIFNTFTTKETYKPSNADTLIGFYEWDKKVEPERGLSSLTGANSILAEVAPGWMYNGKWQRVWSNRLFSEVNIGEFGYVFPEQPAVGYQNNPPIHDLATGQNFGAGFAAGGTYGPFTLERAKPQVYGSVTYFLPTGHGSHDLKAGFEWLDDMANFGNNGASGPLLYLDNNGQPDEIRMTNLGDPSKLGSGWTIPGNDNRREAFYAQDRWEANSHVTATVGVRYDRQTPYYVATTTQPVLSTIFPATSIPGANIFTRNNVAPRLGVTIDPKGDGKTAFKAFYGRYYTNFADVFSVANPGGASNKTYQFLNTEGDGLYHGPQDLGNLISASGGAAGTYVNPALATPYTDQLDLSVEHQFWGQSSIRLAYVRNMARNQFTGGGYSPNGALNTSWVGQFTVPTTVPVQGANGTQMMTLNDIPASVAGLQTPAVTGDPGGAGNWNYNTFEVAFNKRFGSGLFLDSSFDYTRSYDAESPYDVTYDPLQQSNIISPPDYYLNANPAVSVLQQTSTWRFQMSGRYVVKYDIGIGLNWAYQSGWNYAPIGTANLPNAGTVQFWTAPLNTYRSDNVSLVNIRLDKSVAFAGHKMTFMLDAFNVLNANPVTNFNINYGSSYNQIVGMLDPRTFEAGVRFEF